MRAEETIALDQQMEQVGQVWDKEDILDRQMLRRIRERIAYVLIAVFALFNTLVMLICFLQIPLSDVILGSLIGATVVELAAMMFFIVKFLFPGANGPSGKAKGRGRGKPAPSQPTPRTKVAGQGPPSESSSHAQGASGG